MYEVTRFENPLSSRDNVVVKAENEVNTYHVFTANDVCAMTTFDKDAAEAFARDLFLAGMHDVLHPYGVRTANGDRFSGEDFAKLVEATYRLSGEDAPATAEALARMLQTNPMDHSTVELLVEAADALL